VRTLPALVLTVVIALRTCGAAEIWLLDNTRKIAGHNVVLEGTPRVTEMEGARVAVFDGVKDGMFIDSIPFAGAKQYTIEILFRPSEGGPTEQRFVHAQDAHGWRALLETRLNGKGGWWLDTFICTNDNGTGVTLVDRERVHPTDRWYWAALRFDGTTMAHFVNGKKEIEREARFEPFANGSISLGVRQNKVYWFKGAIREVRFHREALPDDKLQRVK